MGCSPCEGLNVSALALYPYECITPKDYSELKIMPYTCARVKTVWDVKGMVSKTELTKWVQVDNEIREKSPANWKIVGPK
jgi:hypothetical protein